MSLISNYEYIRDWCNHKFLTKDDQVQVDLSNYYTKSEVDNVVIWESGTGSPSAILSGSNSTATADGCVAEGSYTTASGAGAHAEGGGTTASGVNSHAEGSNSIASGNASHAEGYNSNATGLSSHAEGGYTQTQNEYEHAEGRNNKSNKTSNIFGNAGNTSFSHGIGSSNSDRKNAVEIMENGDMYVYGVGSYDGKNYSSATTLQNVINNGSSGTLTTTSTSSLSTATNESLSGNINLHKVSKTGSFLDLLSRPEIYVGTCETSAATTAKYVDCTTIGTTLYKGYIVLVTFTYTNSATSPTLNVGGTGAKEIRCIVNGTLTTLPNAGQLRANETYMFAYDGTYWVLMNVDTNTAPGTLTTTSTSGLSTATNEALSGSINLHKVSKTGSYNDLLNKPDLSAYVTTTEYQSDEEVIAASLNDLNNKINTNAITIEGILDEINTPSPRFMNPGDSLDFGNGETETNSVFIRGEYLKTTATVAVPSAYASDISINVTSYDGSTISNPVSIANMLKGVYISLYSNDGCTSHTFGDDEITITSGTATTTIPIDGSNGTPQLI